MDYFTKLEDNPYAELAWNIPERKQGTVNIIGGSAGNFRAEIKVAEFLDKKYQIKTVNLVLPDSLKKTLPPLPNFTFLPSTETGSFAENQALVDIFDAADYNLILGDLSKNQITGHAITDAIKTSPKMTLLTRDTIDIIADNSPERLLLNENLVIMASLAQLQKLLRSIYYPKVITMSQSLLQIAETLHKFTLSYPVSIVTLHNEQILIAQNGEVKALALADTSYSPITLWSGEAAAGVVGMNLHNPNQFIGSAVTSLKRA